MVSILNPLPKSINYGKPIVLHNIENYANTQLLFMCQNIDNTGYESLFAEVLQKIKNPTKEQQIQVIRQIDYALVNTYQQHLKTIEEVLS